MRGNELPPPRKASQTCRAGTYHIGQARVETQQASLKHEARVTMRKVAGREERSLRVYQQGARRGSRAHVEPLVTRPGSQRQKTVWTASIILRDETVLRNMCGIDGHVADETA